MGISPSIFIHQKEELSETANFEGSAKWTDYLIGWQSYHRVKIRNPQKLRWKKLIEAVEASDL